MVPRFEPLVRIRIAGLLPTTFEMVGLSELSGLCVVLASLTCYRLRRKQRNSISCLLKFRDSMGVSFNERRKNCYNVIFMVWCMILAIGN